MRCIILAFGLAVLYFLSIGPAIPLNKRGVISADTFEKVYFPLPMNLSASSLVLRPSSFVLETRAKAAQLEDETSEVVRQT